jgi:hypothetical protein
VTRNCATTDKSGGRRRLASAIDELPSRFRRAVSTGVYRPDIDGLLGGTTVHDAELARFGGGKATHACGAALLGERPAPGSDASAGALLTQRGRHLAAA